MRKLIIFGVLFPWLTSCAYISVKMDRVTWDAEHRKPKLTEIVKEVSAPAAEIFDKHHNIPQSKSKDKVVVKVKSVCQGVPFPDLATIPEPPLAELQDVDSKDRKKLNAVLLKYIDKLRTVGQDTRAKYQAAKAVYQKKCLP